MVKNKLKKTNLKTAIVTGGSRGIGFRIATILAKKGFNVVVCSRNLIEGKKAKKEIESYGVKCLALKVNVSSYKQCKSLVKKTIKKFKRIDLLVNNAAIHGPVGELWKNSPGEWEKTVQINLLGTFYMSHVVIPYMLKQKSGRIINLAGGGAAYARPLFSAYACSKTAVLRLTETLSEELKSKNIIVIALAPGITWTAMTREGMQKSIKINDNENINKLKKVRASGGTSYLEHEKVISYLLSNSSSKLSGKLLHVNEVDKIMKRISKIKPESGLLRRISYNCVEV